MPSLGITRETSRIAFLAWVATSTFLYSIPDSLALSETIPAFETSTEIPEAAENCGYRNLYETPDDPLSQIPIYEQGETDLCYAYTAAQLTEYYLRKNSLWHAEDHINPLWIAIAYKGGHSKGIRIKTNELGHGFFNTAFKDMADLGICDPRVFEKSLAAYKDRSRLSDPDFFFLYEAIWDQRARHENIFTKTGQEYDQAIKALSARADFQRISARAFAHLLDSESSSGSSPATKMRAAERLLERELRKIHRIVKDVPEDWVAKRKKIRYLREVVFGACTGQALLKPELPKSESIGFGWATNRKLKLGIDRMLDAPVPAPAGIGYCGRIYSDDSGIGAKAGRRNGFLPRIAKAINPKCSAHYSLIVGRRKSDAGGCQYLVRNSYGRDFWTERYDCLCEKKNHLGYETCRYNKDTSPTSDRVVGCWIDEKPILNSLYDVSTLRKRDLAKMLPTPLSEVSGDSGDSSE